VIGKVVLAVVPAFGLVGFRIGLTAVVLVIIQTLRQRFWLRVKSDYWKLAVLSVFGVSLNQLLFISGLSLTKASNTSLLAVTIPIFTLAVSAVSGTEWLSTRKVVGIVLAAFGVILMIDPREASFSSETTLGDILIVINSLSYGIYVATSKDVLTRNGAFRSMMWVFIFASIVCIPLGAYAMREVQIAEIGPSIWIMMVYIGLGATAAPYLLNAWALARIDASIVAVYIYLQPLIGFILAVIFLQEDIDAMFIVAAVLIFAGVFLVTRRRAARSS
jgi:drug/metabolite transporter (DMT)-like permease